MKIILTCFFLLLFSFSLVNALMLSPPKYTFDYEPGIEKSCSFSLKNNADPKTITIEFSAYQDEYNLTKVGIDSVNIPYGENVNIPCLIVFPKNMKPGSYTIGVESSETSIEGGGIVSARVGVRMLIDFFVPYPDRYLEILPFQVKNVNVNESLDIQASIINRGLKDVESATVFLKIYDSNGNLVISFLKELKDIKVGSIVPVDFVWKASVPASGYKAELNVNYFGNDIKVSDEFFVGVMKVDIVGVNSNNIKKGNIANPKVLVMSKWNENIPDSYVTFDVLKDGKIVVSGKSQPVIIEPWKEQNISVFVDSSSLDSGTYEAVVRLVYNDKIEEFNTFLKIKNNYIFLIVGLVIFILLLVMLYIFKKMKK